jgi:hypothetical protein
LFDLSWGILKQTGHIVRVGDAFIDVTKGGSAVDTLPSASIPPSRYNDFLFAPICEDADGMRLSVLSALARMDVDPWEEATKLAAMPKAIAQSTLISTLELLSGRRWKSSEAELVAKRLIQLLPEGAESPKTATGEIAAVHAQRTGYWLVWLVFAVAISFLSPHHQATTDADRSKSRPIALRACSPPRTFNLVSLPLRPPTGCPRWCNDLEICLAPFDPTINMTLDVSDPAQSWHRSGRNFSVRARPQMRVLVVDAAVHRAVLFTRHFNANGITPN